MDDATIERFLAAYCPAVERAEAPEKSEQAVQRSAASASAEVLEALRENAGVRRLAANPLLLTALLLVHRARGRLPHRRIDAYVEVTAALGRTWRSVQGVPEAELPDERVLTTWLTRLGAWMHEHRREGSASRRELLEVLGPLWATHEGTEWDPSLLLAADPLVSPAGRAIVDFVVKTERHTGLLVERAAGRYGFPHLTFEEYYAGRALAFEGLAADRQARMRTRLHDSRYDEPILLALGLVGKEQPEELEQLVDKAILGAGEPQTSTEALLGRDFLFALRVLADDVPLGAKFIDRLLGQALDEWFDPESRCRFSRYRASLEQRLSALGATRGATRLSSAMAVKATVHARAAPRRFAELARVLAQAQAFSPEVASALFTLATTADDPYVQVQAAGVLGRAQALTPEVTSALIALATTADNPGVQVQAAGALGQAQALTPEVTSALITLTTTARTWMIRKDAAAILGQAEPAVEVEAALVGLFADVDNDVRKAAGSALTLLASRSAVAAPRILTRLTSACCDPTLETPDAYEHRPGYDYAYDTLWSVGAVRPGAVGSARDCV